MNKTKNFPSKKKKKEETIKTRMEDNLLGIIADNSNLFLNYKASKFRILNEKLYTTTSKEAYDYFTSNPEDYQVVIII